MDFNNNHFAQRTKIQLVNLLCQMEFNNAQSFSISLTGGMDVPNVYDFEDKQELIDVIDQLEVNRMYIVRLWHFLPELTLKRDTSFKIELLR